METLTPEETRFAREAAHEKAKGTQTYDVEDSESEPEPDKEVPEGGTATKSPMIAYLEKMFSKRFDAMQSMVERLPGVAPQSGKAIPTPTLILLSQTRSP